jgi:flagella basal body P-ring formation protein FlgA
MRSRLATIASIVVLVFAIVVVADEVLCCAADPLIPFPTRDVVLAARPIERGATIGSEMLTRRTVPLDDTNAMALAEPAEALGKVAAIDILQFQMITPNLLVSE